MLKKFKNFIRENSLLNNEDEILLAVSGGIDSVVMMDLFDKSGMNFAVAHCNFKLRMFESDDDELFVRQLTHKYNADIYVNWYNTQEFAKQKKISIQEAARELRYAWFNKVCSHNNYSKVAIAHHQDDRIETFLINLSRGSGIKGLKSIPLVRNNIIRPIMFATRNEIQEYAKTNMLKYREDSSNLNDYYLRNRIRHHLIPKLEDISIGFINSIKKSIDNLDDTEQLLKSVINEKIIEIFVNYPDGTKKIKIADLKKLKPLKIWMYYLFSNFGFNRQVTDSIYNSLSEEYISGLRFSSSDYELLIDREHLILRIAKEKTSSSIYKIPDNIPYITKPLKINIDLLPSDKNINFSGNKNNAYFDYDKLQFPLTLRKWKIGDRIIPYGMKGSKLISDILIDNKVDSFEKENVYVILSGKSIIWLVGYRSSNEFSITKSTSNVLIMELLSSRSGFDLELFK